MSASPGFTAVCADLLRSGVPVRFTASGHSMHPAIRDGETLCVEPYAPGRLRPGQVVLVLTPGGPLVHRLQRRLRDGRLLLRGDALVNADAPCAPAACLGRVATVERDGHITIPDPAPSRLHAGACRLARFVRRATRSVSRTWARVVRAPDEPRLLVRHDPVMIVPANDTE